MRKKIKISGQLMSATEIPQIHKEQSSECAPTTGVATALPRQNAGKRTPLLEIVASM